ncbi:hypothetical protein [Staphylococcus aureus]
MNKHTSVSYTHLRAHETLSDRVCRLLLRMCIRFFFQAEDGIRDRSVSRGLGDVYKRQV